jgi:hypothetical protein
MILHSPAAITAIATLLLVAWPSAARAPGYGTFADCIRDSGAVLYEATWCPVCRQQRSLFRGYANRLKTFKCDVAGSRKQTKATCNRLGIDSYPTWIFGDGSTRSGLLSAKDLATSTGCSPPE